MSRSAVLGRVVGLWRYPVKAMAGEVLSQVHVGWHGLAGDRRWAFIRDGMTSSGFPWLTLRECPAMSRYQPRLLDASIPDRSPAQILTPDGDTLDVLRRVIDQRQGCLGVYGTTVQPGLVELGDAVLRAE